jgi:hypothetical protein
MRRSRSLVLLLLAVAVFMVAALPAAVIAGLYPDWAGPAVLAGTLVPGLLVGLLAARWLVGKRRAEFVARLRQRQATFVWACVIAANGSSVSAFGHGIFEVVGFAVTAAGLCVALWAVLRAVPEKANTTPGSPSAA